MAKNKVKVSPAPTPVNKFPKSAILAPLALLALIASIWITYVVASGDDEAETPKAKEESAKALSTGASGQADAHRKVVLNTATELLQSSMDLASDKNSAAIMTRVENNDMSTLPKDFARQIRVVDQIKNDKQVNAGAYISLVQLGKVISDSLGKDYKIKPLNEESVKYVYVDVEAGNAFVPLSLYLGSDAAFSLEFVYVDGEWVYSPYSFIDSVSSADLISKGAQNKIAEDSK